VANFIALSAGQKITDAYAAEGAGLASGLKVPCAPKGFDFEFHILNTTKL